MATMKRLLEQFEYFEDEVFEPSAPKASTTARAGAPRVEMSREQFDAMLGLMDPDGDSREGSYEFMRAMLGLPSSASADDALGNVDPTAEVDPDAYIDERVGSNPELALEAK